MVPHFFTQILIISQFELKRLFSTRKGWLYLITFSIVWYFILVYPIRFASDLLGQSQYSTKGNGFFHFIGFSSLLNWQIPEFGVYWRFALLIFPLLSIIIGSDQTCSDRERGTLRFLVIRVSRDCLFFGRFISMMIIQTLMIVATLFSTLTLAFYRDGNLLATALNSAMAIAVNLILILLPFTAMMAALSATVKSARQSTVWAVLILSFLAGLISSLSSYLPALSTLKILIPGYQMSVLSELSEWQALQLAYIPLLQTLILLGLGRWVMLRQTL